MVIRVLHCVETIGTGGVEQRRLLLGRHLRKEEFHQDLVCSYVIGEFDKKLANAGIAVHTIQGLHSVFNFGYYLRLLQVVRKVRPQIIHGAVFEGVISAIVAGLLLRIPIIIIEETSDPQNRGWRGNLLMRIFSFLADYVVAISPSVMNYLKDVTRTPNRKLKLINNGVDIEKRPDQTAIDKTKQLLGIQPGDLVVGSVGRLRDFHKRFSDLIKAIAILGPSMTGVKLLIVGDGTDRDYLETLAHELNVADRVLFAGYQRETGLYYGCMDIFALASHMEGFGLVVVEAMFNHLPVIATKVGGLKDVVVDEVTGLLVPIDSPESLAKGIQRLGKDSSLRRRLGEAGYHRAMNLYNGETYAGLVHDLYFEACKKKGIVV